MNNHLYYSLLDNLGEGYAKLSDLKYFVREDTEPDITIAAKFPITYFGSPGDTLKIKGTDTLLSAFEAIRAEKLDFVEKLEHIEYMGLTDGHEIILHFKNDSLTASSVYDFSHDFFDELFDMAKFANFCIRYEYYDLLRDNLTRLFTERKTSEKQFRLIQKNGDFFLRGLTSSRYQNYDNNIALYLSILNLHKFATENNVSYRISRARLSDSEVRVFFEQEQPTEIPSLGKVYFGIVVSNSEVREGAVSLELRYRLVDKDGRSFAATDLKDSVLNINHITGVERMESRLSRIQNLSSIQNSIVTLITGLQNMKTLSKDAMYRLYQKIVYSKNFKANTKAKFKELYDQNDVDNAATLVEAFEKVNSITSDLDEKTFLERVYHELITELTRKQP